MTQVIAHELKTWPRYFTPIWDGLKAFEVRKDDRTDSFSVGDELTLREWVPCPGCNASGREWDAGDKITCQQCFGERTLTGYTGRSILAKVTYVMRGGQFGVKSGYVVMGIQVLGRRRSTV